MMRPNYHNRLSISKYFHLIGKAAGMNLMRTNHYAAAAVPKDRVKKRRQSVQLPDLGAGFQAIGRDPWHRAPHPAYCASFFDRFFLFTF